MANAGLQTPDIPAPPPPPAQPDPAQQAQQPTPQGQQIIHINLSHFKPEFSGKPEEDCCVTQNWSKRIIGISI